MCCSGIWWGAGIWPLRALDRFPLWVSGKQGSGGVQGYRYPSLGLSPHRSCKICKELCPPPLQTWKLHEHKTRNSAVFHSQHSSGLRMWVSGAGFTTSLDISSCKELVQFVYMCRCYAECWCGQEARQSSSCTLGICVWMTGRPQFMWSCIMFYSTVGTQRM